MITESLSRNFILVLFCTFIVFLAVIVLYVQDQITQQTKTIETGRLVTIDQIASRTELRIDNAISILKILSKNPHITNPPSATLIDEKIHGIPDDVDVDRRNVMHDAFYYYGGFVNMLFLLPNGDVYINEPFYFQKNMTTSNFAFRNWYKELIDTKDIVVSETIVSKSTNTPNVVIATPIFSQDGLFSGILTGTINIDLIEEQLAKIKSYSNQRILIVDHTGTVVADSGHILRGQSITFGVDAIQNAFSDKHGIVTDTINDAKMVVVYSPINIGQKTWAIVSIESYDDVFYTINKSIEAALFLIILISIISSASIFTTRRYFRIQFKLRKQAEDANAELVKTKNHLLKSEEKYKNLYRLSPDAIVVFDKSGTITSYNESFARLFGYSLVELNGKSIFTIVSDNHLDLARRYFDEIKKIGTIENKENLLKKKDGVLFPSLFSVSTIYDDEIKYICIIKDISEIHNMQEKLKDASNTIQEQLDDLKEMSRIKDEFSTMITHELKTPLVPVTVYCKMLKDNMMGNLNKEQIDAITVIEKNTKNLTRLINDIMDARKLDVKKLKFNLEDVSIDEFLDEIYSNYNQVLNQKGHKIVINISDKDIKIKTDKNRLRQVIDNLISNSLKVIPEKKGLIEINCKKENENIIFHVRDNGTGIPLDKQDKIFQKFYQVDTSATRKLGGTGLGLAISKGIVEGLGGSIWFESDGKTGTTFFVQLPITSSNIHA